MQFCISMKTYLIALAFVFTSTSLSSFAFAQSLPSLNRIELTMTAEQQELLSENKKNRVYNVEYKLFQDNHLTVHTYVKMKTRGQSSIKMARKNFEINSVYRDEDGKRQPLTIGSLSGKRLVFSAGSFDPLLLNNQLVYGMYELAGLPHLKLELAELVVNGVSAGLYMISLHPEEHISENLRASVSFRRGYGDDMEFRAADKDISADEIESARKDLERYILGLKRKEGKELYQHLQDHLDIETYFGLLSVNYLVQNGDYYDEIFFYSKDSSFDYYYFFPWDLDDSFAHRMHLQQIPGSINNGQTTRSREQLLYSFESRLDQVISANDVLLEAYFAKTEKIINSLSQQAIDELFEKVWNRTAPYLALSSVQQAGLIDDAEMVYTPEMIQKQFQAKQEMLTQNFQRVRSELEVIRSEQESRAKKMNGIRSFIFRVQVDLGKLFLGK